ncbi:YcaO-like family protein [Ancylobacter sp. Lp-2]|uniref:YcaO-like family protein n=1 Tax=Ancylobacter sp. Lp-2 TaxID=2881339 RepID=UPI001E6501ED|nr:YcaO-like family protein [Ancylobacter sp. Lp-2]MCB4769554.1 YcaO-like family protein [Ancylobacter sp. Lp-2]
MIAAHMIAADPLVPADLTISLARERERPVLSPAEFDARTAALVRGVLDRRQSFGITRLGSVTRLDRVGLVVTQVVRPLALSNVVSQGKGLDPMRAAASGLMEALESWAGERIEPARLTTRAAIDMPGELRRLYAGSLLHRGDLGWDRIALRWIDGWDLFTDRCLPVPAALVDTAYTYPSPHPVAFPRSTTGLAAAATLHGAIVHAGLEVLERAGVAAATHEPHFFDRAQLASAAIDWPLSGQMLARIGAAGLIAGIWRVGAEHGLPIYWCHVVENEGTEEVAPLPGEGFGCDFTHDAALAKALMEACQARATAIAGAREDITRRFYPDRHDRSRLDGWRQQILGNSCHSPPPEVAAPGSPPEALDRLLRALESAGARAALVVPLFHLADPELHVIRLVVPPLRHVPAGVAS